MCIYKYIYICVCVMEDCCVINGKYIVNVIDDIYDIVV